MAITRRELLRLIPIAGLALLLPGPTEDPRPYRPRHHDAFWRIEEDTDNEHISYDEAAQLAVRFNNAFNRLPPYHPLVTKDMLSLWAMELIPFYPYEGAVDKAVVPKIIDLFWFSQEPDAHTHVLGRSDCDTFILLNVRLSDPFSTWSDSSVEFLFTEAHELAHTTQGTTICSIANNDPLVDEKIHQIEWTAQIVAFENVSALADDGNVYALYALADELRGVAGSVARAAAIRENRVPEYDALREQLYPGELARAHYERSKRFWAGKDEELLSEISRYDEAVLNTFAQAQAGNGIVDGLALQPEFDPATFTFKPRQLKIDDTLYVLAHLEEMIEDARKQIESGKVVLRFKQ